jgi:uncharacterized protein DUF998
MRPLASWSGIVGAGASILAGILGGLQFSEYSHVSQYLSEAYAVGTPYGLWLRYVLYVPSGVLIALFALLAIRELPRYRLLIPGFLGIAIFYGMAMVVGGVFPCDAGCNKDLGPASWSHAIHLASGAFTHAFVPGALLLIGIGARKWQRGIAFASLAAATVCFMCNLVLGADPLWTYVGVVQRMFEGMVLCWVVFAALCLRHKAAAQVREQGIDLAVIQGGRPPHMVRLCAKTPGATRRFAPTPPRRRAA